MIGDAEPYGGGSDGLGGCSDDHADPDGLNTKTELAGMRASGRTLVMIREVAGNPTAALRCYQSLAAGAFPGGDARDGNAADLVTPLVDLVQRAITPLTLTASLPVVLPGKASTVTATLTNPNSFPLQIASLAITVPSAFVKTTATPTPASEGGHQLLWSTPQTLQPGGQTHIRLTLTAGRATSRTVISATGDFQLGTGQTVTTSARLPLFVTRRLAVGARANARGVTLTGAAPIVISARARTAAAASGVVRQGRFRIDSGRKGAMLLRPYAFRLSIAGVRARATFKLRVTRSLARGGCRAGTRGSLTVSGASFGAAGTSTARLALPTQCRPDVTRWQLPAGAIRAVT